MIPKFIKNLVFTFLTLSISVFAFANSTIVIEPTREDMTPKIRELIENSNEKDLIIEFKKGSYKFLPDYASGKYLSITNHGNGYKKIIFNFDKFRSVTIQGNESEFIFHGQAMPFFFESCESVNISGITIDWDIPFTFLGEVIAVNEEEGWRDIKPRREGFSWIIKKGRLEFPNIDGFNYTYPGSTLAFDPIEKRPMHGAWDINSNPRWVEELPNGNLRFHEHLNHYPPVGSLLSSKGDRENDRYAPAFEFKTSSSIILENITIHHALGMGFLFERSENIQILNSGVHLREGSNRVISSTADATHFANCKGSILIENCRFENMLDDGTNVRGTYVVIDKIIDNKTVLTKFMHFEQMGFEFAAPSDEVWFIKQPSPERSETAIVSQVRTINEQFTELSFTTNIPAGLQPGDILENKTWNPEFTMRGCTIRNHRARNIVLKTPLKTIIENNYFSSMMSSVFFRGETFFWFESGGVTDVLIQNNTFEYCAYSGAEHAVLNITPRLGKSFDQEQLYDRNIRFENNTIHTFGNRIVMADRVDGLIIQGNKIVKIDQGPNLYPDAPMIELTNSQNISIEGNSYEGESIKAVKPDEKSSKTLKIENNKGFNEK
ncbi:Right handed beta helix region [Belliella pelovolcani]|uniref:Right handed beta helix region n=2 Tax=Belliella pelovolcani TaxID=529505 RepID=A0A1N7LXJ5_9BACT|nr:Right handed beta helix region [Belliella pelovolcani]